MIRRTRKRITDLREKGGLRLVIERLLMVALVLFVLWLLFFVLI